MDYLGTAFYFQFEICPPSSIVKKKKKNRSQKPTRHFHLEKRPSDLSWIVYRGPGTWLPVRRLLGPGWRHP